MSSVLTLQILVSLYSCAEGLGTSFQESCRRNFRGDQDCYFKVSEQWDFIKFRKWLDNLEPLGKVSLEISCLEGGSIHIPWPMRARNLERVVLKNCHLRGYFAEYNIPSRYPDTLSHRRIENCVTEINLPEWFKMIRNMQFEKSYTCGQESVKTSIWRNNTYRFINVPKTSGAKMLDIMSQISDIFREKVRSQSFQCHYKNLEYLENSNNPNLGKHFMEDLTLHAYYPKLLTLNLSSNKISKLPEELKKWFASFPSLEYLDMSNNKLKSFSFDVPNLSRRQRRLHVNLRNNDIHSPPKNFYQYPFRSVPLSIDLRGNPIR
ncbi:uncharacterized protein LOC133205283 [Saccostrea echinata]|uniref:uncharacterized protein LOC133205283 n=1 Tax=Saccostrea echinata TaxID=191078 RepID=UPI002A7FAE9A|nr:uncharacterized protein LOC133205283 [Saccostrea echinata]